MRVVIRDEAADDLESIFAWIVRDDPDAARGVLRRLRARVGWLGVSGLEHMGRHGSIPGTRELVEPPYIIVYQIFEGRAELEIIGIFHTRRTRNDGESQNMA